MACSRTIAKIWRRHRPLIWPVGAVLFAIALLTFALAAPQPAAAELLKATVTANVAGGYARIIFDMADYNNASVRREGSVLIISFATPLDVSVDRLATQAPGYVGAARRDPDGKAVRLALARKVTVNAMPAGDKFFIDLLPDTWQGVPPGLPEDVVEALARRARDAEKRAARERLKVRVRKLAPVPVHVATEPTFTRYLFRMPGEIGVASQRDKNSLTLTFDAPVRFDLGDVEAALPAAIAAVKPQMADDSSMIHFTFRAKVDVRTFRDENGYAVDIVGASGSLPRSQAVIVPGLGAANTAFGAAPAAAAPASPIAAASTLPEAKASAHPVPHAAPAAQPRMSAAAPAAAHQAGAPSAADKAEATPQPMAHPPVPAAAKAPVVPPHQAGADGKVHVELARDGANLKVSFAFASPIAAAVFQRADTLWLVFDSKVDIELSALTGEPSRTVRSADLAREPDADIVRIKLDRPRLSSVIADGPVWTVEIADSVLDPSRALDLARNMVGPHRASITIPFEAPHALHRIVDPEAGDQLIVVTAFAPARGLIHAQNFIEFRALASEQGVVVEPLADDVNVGLAPDKIVISRPTGLTLSSSLQALLRGTGLRPQTFDSQLWGFDRRGSDVARQSELIAAAAAASPNKRLAPRLDLARFYLAREMYAEAKGVLDIVLAEKRPDTENVSALVLRAVAEIMMNRPEDALRDLANPVVGQQHDASLWRALAYARQGKWGEARQSFKTVEAAIATLPIELQRAALKYEMRAAIEVGDFAEAENELNDLDTIGVPHDMQPAISLLIGRLDEGMGRTEDALAAYRVAADSWDRPAAAQGRLRESLLRYSLGDLNRQDVVSELESLTTVWRGDETEIEALQVLARLYTEDGRYRDSFYVMRSAMAAHPDWDMTRKIQDEAAKTFDSLFLSGTGDSMSAIDALSLFYDFRELTPIGSRGDEMIRRLADRLVSVDLLDQAAGLLQYQVDNRLQGAARAEVATRLAVIYLMDRKPDRALATLRATRSADLSSELRNQRLLLEARALSDLGRYDLALEVVADIGGPVAIRLRSDINWAAQRWRQAAEQIELIYGDRWKQWEPLTAVERSDILRAEIGYALAEDAIGLQRFRDKYAPKMAATPDARAFEIVSAPPGTTGEDFQEIAHAAAAEDTLDDFLRDMTARYPNSRPMSAAAAPKPSPALAPHAAPAASESTAAPAPSPPRTRPAPAATPAAPGSAALGRTASR